MQRFFKIFILLFGLSLFGKEAKAQSDVIKSHISVSTSVDAGRFEFIQSTVSYLHTFLLDKYKGKVWEKGNKGFEEIPVMEATSTINADKINFQLYIGNRGVNDVFLLNIHTGEMWEYNTFKNTQFKKINSPIDVN